MPRACLLSRASNLAKVGNAMMVDRLLGEEFPCPPFFLLSFDTTNENQGLRATRVARETDERKKKEGTQKMDKKRRSLFMACRSYAA